jgi:ribosomal-protein-alanine N-acetyltransferase
MNFRAIPLSPAHAEVAAALHAESGLHEHWSAHAFAELLAMTGVAGLLALTGDDPAGLILWRAVLDEAEILTVCVSPGQRHHGAGRLLLAAAIAGMPGVARLTLEVAENNGAALALYRASGFTPEGRRPGYYRGAEGLTDALILGRALECG